MWKREREVKYTVHKLYDAADFVTVDVKVSP